MLDQNLLVGLIVLAVVALAVYAYAPKLKGLLSGVGMEKFANHEIIPKVTAGGSMGGNAMNTAGPVAKKSEHAVKNSDHAVPKPSEAKEEAFADYAAVGPVANKPQGCYPREQLNPMDLLPSDPNSQWAQVNPTGAGDIQGKNFLSAGALIGINTIGQSMRNANLQLRAEPPNPQVQPGPWNQSTIEPDLSRRPLE